jgi:hypothetical protein
LPSVCAQVYYAILRISGTRDQESKTVKFIFITYLGPSVGGMMRGRVGAHKPDIKEMVGQSHVDFQSDDKDDLTEAQLTDMLKKASGANYDLGSNAGGKYESKAGDIQAKAKNQYKTLEKESNIGCAMPPRAHRPPPHRPPTLRARMLARPCAQALCASLALSYASRARVGGCAPCAWVCACACVGVRLCVAFVWRVCGARLGRACVAHVCASARSSSRSTTSPRTYAQPQHSTLRS